jgi:predicted ArsR family transcriptional regulator
MKVTPDIKQKIKTMGKQNNARQIAKVLGLSTMTVWRHLENRKPVLQNDTVRYNRSRKQHVPEGIFNEHERENWLV